MKNYLLLSNDELLEKLNSKDKLALSVLYDRFVQIVYNISFRILNNVVDAEDVTQEVFIQIWNKANTFDSDRGSVSTWINTIARSRAIDKFRKNKNILNNLSISDESININIKTESDSIEAYERKQIITNALKSLPNEQYVAINIVYLSGYTHSEAAKIIGIAEGTLKTRLRLGISKLRLELFSYRVNYENIL